MAKSFSGSVVKELAAIMVKDKVTDTAEIVDLSGRGDSVYVLDEKHMQLANLFLKDGWTVTLGKREVVTRTRRTKEEIAAANTPVPQTPIAGVPHLAG